MELSFKYVEENAEKLYKKITKNGWKLIVFHTDHGGLCCFPVAWVHTPVHLVEGEILKTEDVKSTSYIVKEAIVKFYISHASNKQ